MNAHTDHLGQVQAFDDLLGRVVPAAAEAVPAFARRLAAENLVAEDIVSVGDLVKLPILTKDDLLAQQRTDPPFGGMVSSATEVRRIFQSPGPIYEAQFAVRDHWGAAPALRAAGIGDSDIVLNCFGYHLTPAGALFEEACFAVGATVVPAGTGSRELQARAVADLGVTAYVGTPTYLKALTEQYASSDLDSSDWQIRKAVVAAEPLPDSLRFELSAHVPTLLMAYGTAETGILAYEEAPGAGLVVRQDVLVQVCDVATGEPVTEGQGQIVVTLMRPDYPLMRFGTGDLSAWADGRDGRPRLVGILGRVGQGVKVRGMFLHPAQIRAVLDDVPGLDGYRMVVERSDHRDQLRCEVVVAGGAHTADVVAQVEARIRSGLRFTAAVVDVARLESEAVIDDRRLWD